MSAMPTVANHWLYRLLKSRSFMHQRTRDNWRTSTYETATQTCISPWKKRKHFFLIILASLVTVSWDQLRRKLGSPLWLFFNDLRFYNTCLPKKKNKRYACDVVMLSLPVSISFFFIQSTDLHELLCRRCVVGGHSIDILCELIQLVLTMLRKFELVGQKAHWPYLSIYY